MKTIYIIFLIVIIMCLLSSTLFGYYYKTKKDKEDAEYKEKKDKEDAEYKEKKDKEDKENREKIALYNKNIDEYNEQYNMNYESNKLYYNDDFKNMLSTNAIAGEPQIKDIIVNDKKIRLYIYDIQYDAVNYTDREIGTVFVWNKYSEKLPFNTVKFDKKSDTPYSTKPSFPVKTSIITTQPLEKDKKFTVYYNYGQTYRLSPPFLEEKYVTYLQKI